ncbi:threonine-phosphate decarboxylase [Niveispirillum sp. SYP-B3756]|nr:threonine-phosphate decarboxylase [Niveispirillum sp. SYP-B3756]
MEAGAAQPHGGDLAAASALFPQAPRPWIDLSTGINPWPYPLPDIPASAWARLPEPAQERALCAAAATAYGVADPALLVAAPGSQILIQTLPFLRAPGHVQVLAPTYGEHAPAWARAGHRVEQVAGLPSPDGPLPDVLLLVNPNNPDGRIVPPASLLALADALAARGGWLVVDEAFCDLMQELSLAPGIGRPGLLVLRSFGKFYGLAGLRLGFLLGPESLVAAMADRLGPWRVAGPALLVASQALADIDWQTATRARLASAHQSLKTALTEAGIEPVGGTALFQLVRSPDGVDLFTALAQAGFWTRRFPDRPGLIRLGHPPDAHSFGRLCQILRSY